MLKRAVFAASAAAIVLMVVAATTMQSPLLAQARKSSAADPKGKPATPSDTIPPLTQAAPPVLCIDCDQPFDTSTHRELLERLAASPYHAELRRALYRQDILHQFESKAHFDNCDFDSAMDYMASLLDEAGKHAAAATAAKDRNDAAATEAAAKRAFFAIGQAMHAAQDFFAHTNYVELAVPRVRTVTDLEIIAPWRPEGRVRVDALRREGLISGVVFWGFPQKCPSGTVSHGDLAKDSEQTMSGKVRVPHMRNMSRYQVARYLAREASTQLMSDAFRRWPILKELNGAAIAPDLLVDRRGL